MVIKPHHTGENTEPDKGEAGSLAHGKKEELSKWVVSILSRDPVCHRPFSVAITEHDRPGN